MTENLNVGDWVTAVGFPYWGTASIEEIMFNGTVRIHFWEDRPSESYWFPDRRLRKI
jgi:hypothetical protein